MVRKFKALIFIGITSLTCGSLTAIIQNLFENQINNSLPDAEEINYFSRPGTITILSLNNKVIQKLGPTSREKVKPGKMPLLVKNAFIAAEDKRFYKHNGVDIWGINRAIITNIKNRAIVEGGSTITQQLARIIFLNQDQTLTRKLKEIALAYKLEKQLNKEEIIEQYINNVYLGSNAYGIADAAWVYFSKTPALLTLEEAALIAGLPPAPSVYSPLVNSKLALQQREKVLRKMKAQRFVSDSELSVALKAPLKLVPANPKFSKSSAPFFSSWIEQKLPLLLSKEQLEIGGLTIHTSLNLSWQFEAQDILKNETPGNTEGAIVAIEPQTGLVKVLVGGKDFEATEFNRATQAFRSPGSTFKLFPYAAAIDQGFQPDDLLFDTPRCWYGYCPKNFGNLYMGEVSISKSLEQSLNTIAVDLLTKVGFKKVITIANQLGIGNERELGEYYPLAIGAYESTLLNMTGAYAGIANRGLYMEPTPIKRIIGPNTEIIWDHTTHMGRGKRVVSTRTADTLNWMLQKVVNKGTGQAAAIKERQIAGKTGTSEGDRDLWFIGSIPQLTVGIWLGNDDNTPTTGGSSDAAMLWRKFIKQIDQDLLILSFPDKPTF